MNHPLFQNFRSALFYAAMWILIIGIHFFIFYFQYGFPFILSVSDSVISNILYAILGIPVWYVVRYSVPTAKTRYNVLFNHLTSMALINLVWVSASYSILGALFNGFPLYKSFLTASIPYRIVGGFFFYVLLALGYYLILYYSNLQSKIKEEARLTELLKETELNMLRSQINPHFLFNSLNSISSLTITDPEKAREMLIKLSDFLRYSVSTNAAGFTSLEKEMINIQRYLEIEKVRFGEKLTFEFNLESSCGNHQVPAMLLQPLFENAIKHGVYESTEQVKIEMDCRFEEDCLIIDIRNNFDPDAKPRKGAGMGLKNIRERLRLLYKTDSLIKTSADGTKYSVNLCLPELRSPQSK